jgi:hypothetical protein
MNVFKKALVALALFAATFSASAIEVSFDFSVFSSGSSIYPCNAGIKHANTNEVICYKRTEPTTTCNPSACVAGEQCDCVCTGTVGRSKVDFFTAEYANWTDHNESVGSSTKVTVKAKNKPNFIFKNDKDNKASVKGNYFRKQLTSLSFDLGSETFGAKYFLDVCFRGPQVDYATAGIKTNWVASSQATIQDMVGYASYAGVAGLEVTSKIVCDYQQAGQPHDVNFVPNNNSFGEEEEYDMIANASLGLSDVASSEVNITGDNKTAPTFCRVRYIFSEGNGLQGRELFRPWKKQAAKVCTKTSIEEP